MPEFPLPKGSISKIPLEAFVDSYCIMQWRNFQGVHEGSSDARGISGRASAVGVCGQAKLTLEGLNCVGVVMCLDVRDISTCWHSLKAGNTPPPFSLAHEHIQRLVFGINEGLRLSPKNKRHPGHISQTTVKFSN